MNKNYIYKFIPISYDFVAWLNKQKKNYRCLEDCHDHSKGEEKVDIEIKKIKDWVSGNIFFLKISEFEKHCNDFSESFWWIDDYIRTFILNNSVIPYNKSLIERLRNSKKVRGKKLLASNFSETFRGKKIGVSCFCHDWNNPLLWAHYANACHGICIEYEISDKCKSYKDDVITNTDFYFGKEDKLAFSFFLSKVEYINEPFILSKDTKSFYEREIKKSSFSHIVGNEWDMMLLKKIFSKYRDWSYEDEFRRLSFGRTENIMTSSLLEDNSTNQVIKINSMIIGHKIDKILKLRKVIVNSFRKYHSDSNVYTMQPEEGTFLYNKTIFPKRR